MFIVLVISLVMFFYFRISFIFRGFGFITFGDPASVDKVLAQSTHELDGKKVSCILRTNKYLPATRSYNLTHNTVKTKMHKKVLSFFGLFYVFFSTEIIFILAGSGGTLISRYQVTLVEDKIFVKKFILNILYFKFIEKSRFFLKLRFFAFCDSGNPKM